MTPAELQAVLGKISCDKMARAWRNRRPITNCKWRLAASKLLGNSKHGGALYVACGEFGETFDGGRLTPSDWANLAARIPEIIRNPPEKALSRREYDAGRNTRKTSRAEVCHTLYRALQLWRSGEAMTRADVWSITIEAERAYRTLFPNPPKGILEI